MQILLMPFFLGLVLNVAAMHPHSAAEASAMTLDQLSHPVVSAPGPYNQ